MSNFVGPYCLVIPAGVWQNSSDVFAVLDPDSGGAATFGTKLSADGLEPATHYAANTMLEENTYLALTTMSTVEFLNYVNSLADQRGRNQLASATAFKNSLQISAEGQHWRSFLEQLGLQVIQPTEG